MGRHPNPRLVKIHRSYAVEEVARILRKHKNTVRAWIKQGLQPIDGRRPTLVHGLELVRFLQNCCGSLMIMTSSATVPLQSFECWFKRTAGGTTIFAQRSDTRGSFP
jgi:Helix-turn-helix domain